MHIATPCSESWERMLGGEQVRFCGRCEKHVYNLSAMTEEQADELLTQQSSGRCVHFERRADGSIVTAPAARPSLPGLAAAAALAAFGGSACGDEPPASLEAASAGPSVTQESEPASAPPPALSAAELLEQERINRCSAGGCGPYPSPDAPPQRSTQLARVVQQHRAEVYKCCDRAPLNAPIKTRVNIQVKKSGAAEAVTYDGSDAAVGQCIAQRAKRWRFPAAAETSEFAFPVVCFPGEERPAPVNARRRRDPQER